MKGNKLKLMCIVACLVFLSLPVFGQSGVPAQETADAEKSELRGDANAAHTAWELIGEGALLIDVRSVSEFESGHIEGALNIPHSDIEALKEAIGPEQDRNVVFYCGSGRRAGRAQEQLETIGYTGIFNATGYDALEATRP